MKRHGTPGLFRPLLLLPIWAVAARAWDPNAGDWSKSHPTDVRVMTWNVEDDIRTETTKVEGTNPWTAMARIVAAMKPDVLILQEVGDNACGGCVDSVAELNIVLELFFDGGADPYLGGTVTAYVKKYDPGFDMPYRFVSTANDSFNRNVILSRFPFADLNGDTKSQISDIPLLLPDAYAPGGNGGIRGFAFAEIDLDDATFVGDLVIGNAHLKAGGTSGDLADRLEAAQNVAYVIDYWLNGAGTGNPDPNGKVIESPAATSILDSDTPVVIGGDWNEDEQTNGRRGPAAWLSEAATAGGTDGTDRDRGDMLLDGALHLYTGSRATQGSSKLDYIAYQDSIATLRRSFVFNTSGTPTGALPNELDGFGFPGGASGVASDHRPVIVDLILPLVPLCELDEDCDDGVFCNGEETCDGFGACQPGTPPTCEDSVACTADSCNSGTDACQHLPNHALCDNGAYCDGAEQCGVGSGCVAGAAPCGGAMQACNEQEDACIAIPAASTWGLTALVLLILSAGTLILRDLPRASGPSTR